MRRTLSGSYRFEAGRISRRNQSEELEAAVGLDVSDFADDSDPLDVVPLDSLDDDPADDDPADDDPADDDPADDESLDEAGEVADFLPRLSVLKKPEPLNVTPTGVKTFLTGRTSPVSGWAISVRLSSWKPCWTSMVSPVSTNL